MLAYGLWDDARYWCNWMTILSRDLTVWPLNVERVVRNFYAGVRLRYSMPKSSDELTSNYKRRIAGPPKTPSSSKLPLDWLPRRFQIGSQRRHHLGRSGKPRRSTSGMRVDSKRRHSSSLGYHLRSDYADSSRHSIRGRSWPRRRTPRSKRDHVRQYRHAASSHAREQPRRASRPWKTCCVGLRPALRTRYSVLNQQPVKVVRRFRLSIVRRIMNT